MYINSWILFRGPYGDPMGLPPADGCSSSRALKLCICVHHWIPRVWGLLIWTFPKKIDSLPAVMRMKHSCPLLKRYRYCHYKFILKVI